MAPGPQARTVGTGVLLALRLAQLLPTCGVLELADSRLLRRSTWRDIPTLKLWPKRGDPLVVPTFGLPLTLWLKRGETLVVPAFGLPLKLWLWASRCDHSFAGGRRERAFHHDCSHCPLALNDDGFLSSRWMAFQAIERPSIS